MSRRGSSPQKRQDALIALGLSRRGAGTGVTSVSALAPLASSGGVAPVLSLLPGRSVVATVANRAALTALPLTPALAGQYVYVATYGAYFALQPSAGLPLRDAIVIASSSAAFVWERALTAVSSQTLKQLTWFVDPTAGNNENTGLTALTPIREKGEITRRWGTLTPVLDGVQIVLTMKTPDLNGDDPWIAAPYFINGASFRITAALPPAAFTGTLLAVTPKNEPANTALHSTFTTTTGAIAPNMLLVNATRGNSRAIAALDTGGGNWLLSQPLAPYPGLPNPPTPTNVDTWAAGDAISGFVPINVDIGSIDGLTILFGPTFGPSFMVDQVTIFDPLGVGNENPLFCHAGVNYFCNDVICERAKTGAGRQTANPNTWQNCSVFLFFCESNQIGSGTILAGGLSQQGGIFQGVIPTNGFLFVTNAAIRNCFMFTGPFPGADANMYFHTGAVVSMIGNVTIATAPGRIYGPGTLNATGDFIYTGSAVTQLPVANKTLNGIPTGYSNATPAPGAITVVHGGIPLTSANLDAVSGAAGFGGFAWGGGASISTGAQP